MGVAQYSDPVEGRAANNFHVTDFNVSLGPQRTVKCLPVVEVGFLNKKVSCQVLIFICFFLQHLHSAGIIHRVSAKKIQLQISYFTD